MPFKKVRQVPKEWLRQMSAPPRGAEPVTEVGVQFGSDAITLGPWPCVLSRRNVKSTNKVMASLHSFKTHHYYYKTSLASHYIICYIIDANRRFGVLQQKHSPLQFSSIGICLNLKN